MPFFEANDQTRLFYTDWGKGKPVVFVHAWAMSSAMWEYQMLYFTDQGLRCIAYDRRGHGHSDRPGHGYHYDQHADDLASLIEQLDLQDITLIGHSMGGGEIIRYLTRHGADRVSRVVLLAPALPFLLKTDSNPDGLDAALLENNRADMRRDFPAWLARGAEGFYRQAELGVSDGIVQWTMDMILETSLIAAIEGNRVVVETDFRPELQEISLPILFIHGDADQSIPVHFGRMTARLLSNRQYKEYNGAPHGFFFTHMDKINQDIFSFFNN